MRKLENLFILGAFIMSIFSPAAIKIRDLLGLTARGQTTMANSLPVALASNQSALPVTDNSGSLTVDGTVAVSGVGGSVTVVDGGGSITVDGDFLTDAELRATPVPVADGGGSITVDGDFLTDAELRATPVPVADGGGSLTVDGDFLTDAELRATPVPVEFTGKVLDNVWWEARRGYSGGLEPTLGDLLESDAGAGVSSSVASPTFMRGSALAKASLESAATIAKINEYFSGNHANFNGDPIWVRIPFSSVWAYRQASIVVINSLTASGSPITLEAKIYGMASDGELFTDSGSFTIAATSVYADEIATLSDGGRKVIDGGGAFPYLLLKLTPSADPDGGYWVLVVSVSE